MAYAAIPDQFPVLRGPRVLLREFLEEDLPAWFARMSDVESADLAGDPVAASMADVEAALAHHRSAFLRKEGLRWAIVPEKLGASIGSIGLVSFDPETRAAEVGAVVGRRYWGQGLAADAGRLVLGYAFSELSLLRVHAVALERNAAAIAVLHRLGFVRSHATCPEGTMSFELSAAAWSAT